MPVPDGKDGWLLFLDEMNSAAPAVQAAAYKLVLDKMVGQHKLHKRCVIVCAGNLSTDGAIVNDLGTAMQSRLIHLELEVNSDLWLEWAYKGGVDPKVTAYIEYAPEKLHMFDPSHNDKTFACPRTWHFLSKVLTTIGDDLNHMHIPILEGAIGAGAREFYQFCELENDLPTFESILKEPKKVKVPKDPATVFFLCGSLGAKATKDNLSKVLQYMERLPIEFQIVAFRGMTARDRTIATVQCAQDWISKYSKEMI